MSDYRDDREALRARADALEQALADKQRELDALKQAASPASRSSRREAASPAGVARDEVVAIERLERRARAHAAAFVALALATLGWSEATRRGWVSTGAAPVAVLLASTVVAAAAALIASGRPLRRRTGFDVDFMVSRVWLPGFLGLLLPPAAIIDACLRLTARSVGGYHTTREGGGGRYYPKVELSLGEGRALGLTLLAIATLWPAAAVSAAFATGLVAR